MFYDSVATLREGVRFPRNARPFSPEYASNPNNGILLTFSHSGDGTAPFYVTADGGQTWTQGIADSQLSLSKKLFYFEDGTAWNLSIGGNQDLYRYSN